MRTSILAAALLWGMAGCSPGPHPVVEGFHGYPWGTLPSRIPEVALAGTSGERDGLLVYSAEVPFLGRDVLAVFYFDATTLGLVEGAYILSLRLDECDAEWERYRAVVADAHPTFIVEETVPRREEAERPVYESDCEYFVFNAHRLEWIARFRNPESPGDGIELQMQDVGRTARLSIHYRGQAPQDEPGPEGAGGG